MVQRVGRAFKGCAPYTPEAANTAGGGSRNAGMESGLRSCDMGDLIGTLASLASRCGAMSTLSQWCSCTAVETAFESVPLYVLGRRREHFTEP
jgi:hypothetical protein